MCCKTKSDKSENQLYIYPMTQLDVTSDEGRSGLTTGVCIAQ